MICAIVLAAGESRRMGMPKPLLRFVRGMGVPPMSPRGILSLDHPPKANPKPVLEAGASGIGTGTLNHQQFLQGQSARGSHGRDGRATHGRDAHATKSDDTAFLEQIISVLRRSEVDRITVVLGAHAQAIQGEIDFCEVDVVLNKDYREGQLSSLIAGLKAVPAQTEAILLCLVDNPLISGEIVARIIGAFRDTGKPMVVPVFEGRRGHPALFARVMFDELLNAPANEGARHVVQSNKDRVLELEVPDPSILVKIDTPQDYLSHFGIAPQMVER